MTPIPSKEAVQAVVDHYHRINGEYLPWAEVAKITGFGQDKTLKRYIEKYAPAYLITVRERQWPKCGNVGAALAREATRQGKLVGELTRKPAEPEPAGELLLNKVRAVLKAGGTLDELSQRLGVTRGLVVDAIDRLRDGGLAIQQHGEHFAIVSVQQPSFSAGRQFEYRSRPDNWYVHGIVGDTHLCSKYERLDVLNSLYDIFASEGVDRVFHCGNMIDGHKVGINDHDVSVIGMDDQIAYLVERYPRREGITTYAVSGDDHEGWFAQKMGVDVGKRIEQTMREAGRTDWVDLGYMEAHINLVNAMSGKKSTLAVVHPGGGSAYADSYSVQKIIESYEGGEKPAVAYYGHYHKQLFGEYRNVFWAMPGCTQDQTPFARKKKLRFVIGGAIAWLKQDPDTGAIVRFKVEILRYFNRGYYNDRWSHAGPIVLPDRGVS